MKNTKPLVVLGSARAKSDTRHFVESVFSNTDYQMADLLDFHIAPYSYENNYPEKDGFITLINQLLQHEVIVFATPVYWYAMSGLMKTFFDRLTDLITVHKGTGRQLKGKQVYLIVVGTDAELPVGFDNPFKLTCAYLQMEYNGSIYFSMRHDTGDDKKAEIQNFIQQLQG